jgi:hypothetical protein
MFSIYLEFTQPVTEMSTRGRKIMFLGSRARPVHKAYKLSFIEDVERWIVCTPLSVNVFVTLATQ